MAHDDGIGTPRDQHDHHDGDQLHDVQSFFAGFGNALGVFPPEISGDHDGKTGGDKTDGRRRQRSADMHVHQQFTDEPGEILARSHAADGAGENVIEHQSGYAEFGERAAESALDGAIHAAADEHAATFHVHRAHGIRKNHDGQDEPGSGFADVGFGFTARVVGGRCQVVQNDGGGAPERDECQEGRGRNNDTRDPGIPGCLQQQGD